MSIEKTDFSKLPPGTTVFITTSYGGMTGPTTWMPAKIVKVNHRGNVLVLREGDEKTREFRPFGSGAGENRAWLVPASPENIEQRAEAVRRWRALLVVEGVRWRSIPTDVLERVAAIVKDHA